MSAEAHELRRCLYSLCGQLDYVREHMPECPEGFALSAIVEGGIPAMFPLVDALAGDHETPPKSFARGYQVMALMAEEERTGERNPDGWKEDPDEFMARRAAS